MVQWDSSGWGGDASAWYCQKRIRPLLRGWSHAAACVLSPIYAAERIAVAKTNSLVAAVLLEAAAQMILFGASAAYHRGRWSRWGEALAARIDYMGIFTYIGFCSAPLYVSVFGTSGWLMLMMSAMLVLFGAWCTFSKSSPITASRETMTMLYVLQGAFLVVPLTIAFTTGQLNEPEIKRLIVAVTLFFVGAQLYMRTWPVLSPRIFSYHDLFHLFVVSGAFTMHCANWHALHRYRI